MPRQGDMSIIDSTMLTVSARATIQKRIAVFIDVVYRAACVEPRHDSVAISVLGGVAYLLREGHDVSKKVLQGSTVLRPWRRTDDTGRLKQTRLDVRLVPAGGGASE